VKQRLPAIASFFCFKLARPPERAAEGATAKKSQLPVSSKNQ
jgi:hypothetical protein